MKNHILKMNDLYTMSNLINQNILNTGFDYKTSPIILKRCLSPNLLDNVNLSGFLDLLDGIVVNNIEACKRVRIFNNFTVPKNTYYIN